MKWVRAFLHGMRFLSINSSPVSWTWLLQSEHVTEPTSKQEAATEIAFQRSSGTFPLRIILDRYHRLLSGSLKKRRG